MSEDNDWRDIRVSTPETGAKCIVRLRGNESYTSAVYYEKNLNEFRQYEDKGNRFIITIWKVDEWKYDK